MLAGLARAANAPTEIRLLNNSTPICVGRRRAKDSELTNVVAQLSIEPSGQTPICAQLHDIIKNLRKMEPKLRKSKRVALLVLITDGTSTDGDVINVLRPLEGFPLRIVVRILTEDKELIEYWQHINSTLNLDICIMTSLKEEAAESERKNSWLTYAEPLFLLREFGVEIPGIDMLRYRQLPKEKIKAICQLLLEHQSNIEYSDIEKLGGTEGNIFSDPTIPWDAFLSIASELTKKTPMIVCPIKQDLQYWLRLETLYDHRANSVDLIIEKNEDLLWSIFLACAVPYPSSSHAKEGSLFIDWPRENMGAKSPREEKMKTLSSSKHEKKLLKREDLWQLFTDLDLVPTVVNTIRFNRLLGEIKSYSLISFREFVKIIIRASDLAYPKKSPISRLIKLLNIMNRSDLLLRMGAHDGPNGESKAAEGDGDGEGDQDRTSDGESDEDMEVAGLMDNNLFQMLSTSELMLCSPPPSTPSKRTLLLRNSMSLSMSIICQEMNSAYESPWSVVKERSRSPVDGYLFSPPSNEKGIVSHLGGRTLKSYFNQRVETWNVSPVSKKPEKSEKRNDDRFSSSFENGHLDNGGEVTVAEERFSVRFENIHLDNRGEGAEERFSVRFENPHLDDEKEVAMAEERFSIRFEEIHLDDKRDVTVAEERYSVRFEKIHVDDGEEGAVDGRGRMDDVGAVEAAMEEMICITEMREEHTIIQMDSDEDDLQMSAYGDDDGDETDSIVFEGMAGEFFRHGSPEGQLSETDEAPVLLHADADELVHMVDRMELMMLDRDDDSMCLSLTDYGSEVHTQSPEACSGKEICSEVEVKGEGEGEDKGAKESPVSGDALFAFPAPRSPVPASACPMSPSHQCPAMDSQIVSSPTALMDLLTSFLGDESDFTGIEGLDSGRLDSHSKKQFIMYLRSPPKASRRESLRVRIEQGEATAVEAERNLSHRLEAEERLKVINKKCESVRRKSVCFVDPSMTGGAGSAQKITYGEFHTEFDVTSDEKKTPLSVRYVLNEEDASQSSRSDSPLKPAGPPKCLSWLTGQLLLLRRNMLRPPRFR
jgi:hypothetical protein